MEMQTWGWNEYWKDQTGESAAGCAGEIEGKRSMATKLIAAGLSILLLHVAPIELSSEMITFSTTYPSPVGIYARLITTGGSGGTPMDTSIGRDNGNVLMVANNPNGNVGIGTGTDQPHVKLDVRGLVQIGTDSQSPCASTLAGALRWFVKAGDPNTNTLQVCDGISWKSALMTGSGAGSQSTGNFTFHIAGYSYPAFQGTGKISNGQFSGTLVCDPSACASIGPGGQWCGSNATCAYGYATGNQNGGDNIPVMAVNLPVSAVTQIW